MRREALDYGVGGSRVLGAYKPMLKIDDLCVCFTRFPESVVAPSVPREKTMAIVEKH